MGASPVNRETTNPTGKGSGDLHVMSNSFRALGFGFAASTMSATFINGVLGPQTK